MNTAFTRLVWKEYRAQRTLWLILFLGGCAMHVALRILGAPWTVSLGLASVFSIGFLVAELSIAFAGEVDEGTVGLLRMLPCRTNTLISAKLTALVGGFISLTSATLFVAGVFELIALLYPQRFRGPEVENLWSYEDPLVFGLSVALFSSASLFASLLCRRVISAVGVAVTLIMTIFFVALSTSPNARFHHWATAVWLGSISIVLLCISVFVLARRWHLGRLPGNLALPSTIRNRTTRRLPSLAGVLRPWLLSAVSRPMSQWRVFSTLLWRECRSAIPFTIVWLTLGMVICAGRFFYVEYPWPLVFLIVFIHECGQRTMREDQRSGAIQFLANIGLAPKQIYSSKFLCWLSVAIIGIGLVAAVDTLIPLHDAVPQNPARELRILGLIDVLRVPTGERLGLTDSPATMADRWLQAGLCSAVFLGLFTLGQLTASWIQRQVLAFAASFAFTFFAAILLFPYVVSHDWSVWVALVPIPLCLLLATRTTARQWIDRTITWRLRFCQTAWIVIPLLCFPLLAGYLWFCQPAQARETLIRNSVWAQLQERGDMLDPSVMTQFEELSKLAQLPPSSLNQLDKSEGAKCWYEFFAALENLPDPGLLVVDSTLMPNYQYSHVLLSQCQQPNIGPEEVRKLLKPFDEFLNKTDAFPTLPLTWTAPWSGTPAATMTAALLEDARLLEADGDVSGAVRQIVRAIRLCKALEIQTSSWSNWVRCLDAERVALGRLRILLGTADLTTVDLEALFQELKTELVFRQHEGKSFPQFHDIRPMLRRRTLFYAAAVRAGDSFFPRLRMLPIAARGFDALQNAQNAEAFLVQQLGPIGAARAVTALEFSEALLLEKYQTMPLSGRVQYQGTDQTENIALLQRFLTASMFPELQSDLAALESGYYQNGLYAKDVATVASERATLLTIKLQQYRLANGKFPETLLELLDDNRTNYLLYEEPWSGNPFIYLKQTSGQYAQFRNHGQATVSTGSAVLASHDAWISNTRLPMFSLQPEGIADVLELPANLVLFIGTPDPIDWRLKQIATSQKLVPKTDDGQ